MALHASFLRRTAVGLATISFKVAKLGRNTSVIHFSLRQSLPSANNVRECIVGLITQANLDSLSGPVIPTSWALEPPAIPVDLELLKKDKDDHWFHMSPMPHESFRAVTKQLKFYLPKGGSLRSNLVDEWLCMQNGERFTMDSIGLVADLFPQIVEQWDQQTTANTVRADQSSQLAPPSSKYWFPTVLLNLDIKKSLPSQGVEWLFVRAQAKQIKNGRFDLEVIVLDASNDLVAISNHLCMIVPAARSINEVGHREVKDFTHKI